MTTTERPFGHPYLKRFQPHHMEVLDETAVIAEEVASNHFALSSAYWRKHPYEISTLEHLRPGEYSGQAFAHVVRYGRSLMDKQRGKDSLDLYRICLNDHNILEQTEAGERARLFPFLLYILTHELVHIIRFGRYDILSSSDAKGEEESRVHELTHVILKPMKNMGLEALFERFPVEVV